MSSGNSGGGAAAELSRKAQEAAAAAMSHPLVTNTQEAAAAAMSHPLVTNIREQIASINNGDGRGGSGGGVVQGFAFLDNMCGPVMDKFRNGGDDDDDDSVGRRRGGGGRRDGGRDGRGGRGRDRRGYRRPHASYDYDDDETEYTDYDDDTYADDTPNKRRGGGGGRNNRGGRGRARSDADDESNYTGYTGYTDDDTLDNDTTYNSRMSRNMRDDDTLDSAGKLIQQPLASGFAKRCYFTKAGIGRTTQHYEGLTLTGNTILMLASAMNLKGCPTICDEDLRRVEQTYPNQFSRLPDELLLSSGWRRISKYCHFSHKPLPDGVPFFHSRQRCHPSGGFYFLLCSAVGMVRLIDVEPLTRDALVVLQTDYPLTCEKAPRALIEDPNAWTLVNKFCFFSGGPINVDEDVYYKAELSGNEIYMLAFLSPSLSPEELYRLKESPNGQGGDLENTGPLKSVKAVEEVESVYDLTHQDFDDLKLYHLGPCRALPPNLLNPEAWTKVLPPPFATAREEALMIARDWESRFPPSQPPAPSLEEKKVENISSGYVELGKKQQSLSQDPAEVPYQQQMHQQQMPYGGSQYPYQYPPGQMQDPNGYYQNQAPHHPSQYGTYQQYGAPPMGNNPNAAETTQPANHYGTQSPMRPQMEMEGAYSQQQHNPSHDLEVGAGWDQPDDEAYIPCNNRAMRDHQMEPDGDGDGGAQVIREDPPESKEEGSRLKQMAIKRIEEKSPNRSLASKLAAKRAAMLPDEADESTLGGSTLGNSTYASSFVSESTADMSCERNSRRALILQMAKARMKNVKKEKGLDDPVGPGHETTTRDEGRNESPPSSNHPSRDTGDRVEAPTPLGAADLEDAPEGEVSTPGPRDELSTFGAVSTELSVGVQSLELD